MDLSTFLATGPHYFFVNFNYLSVRMSCCILCMLFSVHWLNSFTRQYVWKRNKWYHDVQCLDYISWDTLLNGDDSLSLYDMIFIILLFYLASVILKDLPKWYGLVFEWYRSYKYMYLKSCGVCEWVCESGMYFLCNFFAHADMYCTFTHQILFTPYTVI